MVSIGMPVYNGEQFIREAVDSLLSQTMPDFELLISDNASTDGTRAICEDYARRDPRVRYIRQAKNLGAVANWNFVAEKATGTYFKWASANDYCAKEMLSHCVQALEADPSLVLAYGKTMIIDDAGAQQGEYLHDPEILHLRPSQRFIRTRNDLAMNNAQSGLIRLSALRKTRGDRSYPGGDMVLMAELALLGGIRRLPVCLLYRRMDRLSTARLLSDSELQHFLRPQRKPIRLPTWRKQADYAWSVLRSPIAVSEKLKALAAVLRWSVMVRQALIAEVYATVRRTS